MRWLVLGGCFGIGLVLIYIGLVERPTSSTAIAGAAVVVISLAVFLATARRP